MTISEWLRSATQQIKACGIDSARLDAELILAHTVRKPRTYLHAHLEDKLDSRQLEVADARLTLRLDHTPIAYIIGHKEFYGRRFKVTPAVLIPRPETEVMIEMLLCATSGEIEPKTLIDIGTGSGILGITAKLERPNLRVILSDVSRHALKVAADNAKMLNADVEIVKSDLLSGVPARVDYILANLPYVDKSWQRSVETNFEPDLALFAEDDGLALVRRLLEETQDSLNPSGWVFLEADPRQHAAIIQCARKVGLRLAASASVPRANPDGFILALDKPAR